MNWTISTVDNYSPLKIFLRNNNYYSKFIFLSRIFIPEVGFQLCDIGIPKIPAPPEGSKPAANLIFKIKQFYLSIPLETLRERL
jgi:hypothetical protein